MARMNDDKKDMPKPWRHKSAPIQDMLATVFSKAKTNIDRGLCAGCGSEKMGHDDFKDDISRKELTLTGWCQKCQDAFFK